MPTRAAMSRSVSPAMLVSCAASQAASRISCLIASCRSAFLSPFDHRRTLKLCQGFPAGLRLPDRGSWPGVLPREGGEEQLAGGLSDRRLLAVLPEGFPRARDDVRVGVDLLGRADHAVDLP